MPLLLERSPNLWSALEGELGEIRAAELVAAWTQRDLDYFEARLTPLLNETTRTSGKVRSGDSLFASFGNEVFGVIGETIGVSAMRAKHPPGAANFFVDEVVFSELNPYGKKPDGLVARIEADTLILTEVLESKMGAGGYDSKQMREALEGWIGRGLTVPHEGAPRQFPPSAIVVQIDAETRRPLSECTQADLQKLTTVVATRPHPNFTGQVLHPPFLAINARNIAFRFIENLVKGRTLVPKHSNFITPKLVDPVQVRDFQEELRDWIYDKGDWPKSAGGGIEKWLAREISSRGGQGPVFLNDLDPGARHLLTHFGRVPALGSLRKAIQLAPAAEPNSISALRAYLRRYEPTKPSTLLAQLRTASPAWRAYLTPERVSELYSASVEEVNLCLDSLIALSRRKKP